MAQNSPITLAAAKQSLSDWLTALEVVSTGASYSIAGRSVTRQDIGDIRAEIQRWHNTVEAIAQAEAGNTRTLGARASFPAPGSGGGANGIIPDGLWSSGWT